MWIYIGVSDFFKKNLTKHLVQLAAVLSTLSPAIKQLHRLCSIILAGALFGTEVTN
jgi:hypothetical protein